MTILKKTVWFNAFDYQYTKFEEIPQALFDDINQDLDKITSGDPLVSILIAAWNEEVNILKSVASLSKTVCDFPIEIIVINNNSKDKTQDTIDKLHVKSLFEQAEGTGPARQLGQVNARGKYILLADADCFYPSCWVTEMIKVLQKPGVVCVYGRYSFISEPGFPRWQLFILEKMKDIIAEFRQLKRPYFNTYGLSMGYIKEYGLKIGFISSNFRGDDGQMCLRLMEYGKIRQVRSNKARIWTGPRTLQRDGTFGQVLKNRLLKEFKRFFKNFNSKLPNDVHKS